MQKSKGDKMAPCDTPWVIGSAYCCMRYVQYTAVSRKVVRRNAHATIPKGNMGYDQYTVCND